MRRIFELFTALCLGLALRPIITLLVMDSDHRRNGMGTVPGPRAAAPTPTRAEPNRSYCQQLQVIQPNPRAKVWMPGGGPPSGSIGTKSELAVAVLEILGAEVAAGLECSCGFDLGAFITSGGDPANLMLPQYSADHFPLGSPHECAWPFSRSRLVTLLMSAFAHDGGSSQCPEVGEMYEDIARRAPDGTVFCDMGFNAGSSSATFLFGSRATGKMHSVVHAFDLDIPVVISTFLNRVFGQDLSKQDSDQSKPFMPHVGSITNTVPQFVKRGLRCDVVFLDSVHPLDYTLAKSMVRNQNSLVLYHYHFRNSGNREYFFKELREENFMEKACTKTLCRKSHNNGASPLVLRESCFGNFNKTVLGPGQQTRGTPWWWHTTAA